MNVLEMSKYTLLNEESKEWIWMGDYHDRYSIVDDGFVKYIYDTTLTEDKHESAITDAYELLKILNEQDKMLTQYQLQLQRKDATIKVLRKQIDNRIRLFNKYLEETDDENVKKVLRTMCETSIEEQLGID